MTVTKGSAMVGKNDKTEKGITIRCNFEKGLQTPLKCVSCAAPVSGKKIDVIAFNSLHTNKVIFKFPVCDDCCHANEQYVDIKPIILFGCIAFLLSIFTLINQPGYLQIPKVWHLAGGMLWLFLLTGFVTWSAMRARKQNLPEIVERRLNLVDSVKSKELITPRKFRAGEVVFMFSNLVFAKEFKKLNKDLIPK